MDIEIIDIRLKWEYFLKNVHENLRSRILNISKQSNNIINSCHSLTDAGLKFIGEAIEKKIACLQSISLNIQE